LIWLGIAALAVPSGAAGSLVALGALLLVAVGRFLSDLETRSARAAGGCILAVMQAMGMVAAAAIVGGLAGMLIKSLC
jgi:hypothetical protein